MPSEIDLDLALTLLSLPRPVGQHPESGDIIVAGVGRFGPYLKVGDRYVKLGQDDDVLSVGLNRAVTIIAEAPARRGAAKTTGKILANTLMMGSRLSFVMAATALTSSTVRSTHRCQATWNQKPCHLNWRSN